MLQLQSNIDFVQDTMVDKQMIVRLEAKIRELESRFDLEQTTRHRVEVGRTCTVVLPFQFIKVLAVVFAVFS